jgi:cellulose biosynthesis protein BcsQ
MAFNSPGRIITFYSYKGGTGRSMSLANIAWVLASNGRRVLAVDWDLEAPGLHRYFYPFLVDKELTSSDGVIDFMIDFECEAMTPLGEGETLDKDWYKPHADILRYAASLDWEFPGDGTLDFIPAGRQGDSYSSRVTSFNWQNFYDRLGGGVFLEAVKDRMREEYDYILIDSRTGVSDASGICTVQMPDALAICFTLNHQSIEGAAAVATSVYEQRRRSGSPIQVFPIPMRVENGEKEKLERRREYARKHFDRFPAHIPYEKRGDYWGEVEVIYVPYYAYEEILAPFGDQRGHTVSLLAASERLTAHLTKDDPQGKVEHLAAPPEQERRRVLAEYARTPSDSAPVEEEFKDRGEEYVDVAENVFFSFTPEQQAIAKRVLTRLVRLPPPEEVGAGTRLRVKRTDLGEAAKPILDELVYQQLVFLGEDETTKEETVELAHDALAQKWKRMRDWLTEDRDFLLWRQGLQLGMVKWESTNRDEAVLLHGAFLKEAEHYRATRTDSLTNSEYEFIAESARDETARQEAARRQRQKETEAELETIKVRAEKYRLGLRMGALIIALLLSLIISYPFIFHRERALIYLGIMPSRYVDVWSDDFLMTSDHKPDGTLWDNPTQGQWVVEKGEGTAPDDGALLVKGTGMGVIKVNSAKFYDFTVDFKVGFVQGAKTAWVFRTQYDKQNGYLFVLEKQTREIQDGEKRKKITVLILEGYIYRGLNNLEPMDYRGGHIVPIRDCCRDDDAFRIRAEVKDYEFRYWVTLEPNFDSEKIGVNSVNEDPRPAEPAGATEAPGKSAFGAMDEDLRLDTGVEYFVEPFKDERSLFRYGSIGLLEPDDSSEMKVQYIRVTPVATE